MKIERDGRKLRQSVYEQLRSGILSGRLPVEFRLHEEALAESMGVSRTPIREAMAGLIRDGLVIRSSGGQLMVRRLTIIDFVEVLHIRRLLESDAARRAAVNTESRDPLLKFRGMFEVLLTQAKRPNAGEHMDLDEQFHIAVASLSGSSLLAEYIQNLKLKTRMFDQGFLPDRFEPGCREHIAIIDAIVEKNADRAEEKMQLHIDNARKAIFDHLNRLT